MPRELIAICSRAMAIRPRDRFATPLELANDLERHLRDEPIATRLRH